MSDITISYKGNSIATMDASGTKTLLTSGKYCEDDIEVAYVKSGGQEMTLLASGAYTLASNSSNMSIPVSYTGTPLVFYVRAATTIPSTAKTYAWCCFLPNAVPTEAKVTFGAGVRTCMAATAAGSIVAGANAMSIENGNIKVAQETSSYPILANDYNWYIWGYET